MKLPGELTLRKDEPLAPRTTLELGGSAELFLEATDATTLTTALAFAASIGMPVSLLGGGSNTLVPDAGVAGLVIQVGLRGRSFDLDGERARVRLAAGEVWDDVVAECVSRGLAGLECLSGIPGSVGATPIQNVGAYGVEVADVLESVELLDRATLERSTMSARECAFAYRDSVLKRHPERFVVTAATFALRMGEPSAPRYAELAKALAPGASLAAVRETVIALRRAKSMVLDPADPNRRSAGSFFTNPIVGAARADAVVRIALERGLVTDAASVPRWPQPDGRVKLAAGWLIEKSGTRKGERIGAVGVSSVHALALVHHGGGSTRALLALADTVTRRVHEAFGVDLEREPVMLGPARVSG